MRLPLAKNEVLGWLVLVLAVLVFLVPIGYLPAVWWRRTPPSNDQVERATIEIVDGAYHLTLPGGFKYVVDASVGGPDQARGFVIAQARDEHEAFSRAWATFWFLLAAAFGASTILILIKLLLAGGDERPSTDAEGGPATAPAEQSSQS